MKVFLRIFVLAVFSVLLFFALSEKQTENRNSTLNRLVPAFVDQAVFSDTNNSKTALRVLKKNCGSCHQSTLKTAKPKALEIFDLDKERWHESVKQKHLGGISRRISKSKGVTSSDSEATLAFIACVQQTESSGTPTVC